jgi:hypothetical protein
MFANGGTETYPGKYLSFISWQRKFLHRCFNITSKNELCSNFRCQKMKEKEVSPDRYARLGTDRPGLSPHSRGSGRAESRGAAETWPPRDVIQSQGLRTGPWTGPPREKRAPRVSPRKGLQG